MVRYRGTLKDHAAHYLFGWTDDDRIFWASVELISQVQR